MFELLVCIAASIGAGTTAGLAGISTATVISPLLIALLGFDAYEALDIALAADVLSSALGRIGSRFFLCVTVRFSERIAARSLFSEYGVLVGAGRLVASYIGEHADAFIPDAVAKMGRYLTL